MLPRVVPSEADDALTTPLILTLVAVVAGLSVIVPDAFAIIGEVNEDTDGVLDKLTVGATVGVPPITILADPAVTEVTVPPLLGSPETVPVNVVVPVALPMVVLPVPVELMLTVGETSATVPAPEFPIVVVPAPVVLRITAGDTRATEFPVVVLPIIVAPPPVVLIFTVGETTATVPAVTLPTVVVPVPVVFKPRAALMIGLGMVDVGTVSVTAPVPPTGETVRFAFADVIDVTPPLPLPPCCVARTLRYAKTEDVASELATTIGATPDIFKGQCNT